MLRFGIERGCFIVDKETGKAVVVPSNLPMDCCGLLVEFRGSPFTSIEDAVGSAMAAELKVERMMANNDELANLELSYLPVMDIDRATRIAAARLHEKGMIEYRNMYGHISHRNKIGEMTAGIHLSVTDERTETVMSYDRDGGQNNKTVSHNVLWDFSSLFRLLDKMFVDEIKDSKRNPGFYELKHDGRIEYRSLPTNIDYGKLIDVVHEWENWRKGE